jgi:hypothetical protein
VTISAASSPLAASNVAPTPPPPLPLPLVVVVGGLVLDVVAEPPASRARGGGDSKNRVVFVPGTSNIGEIRQSLGGVAKNVAEAATKASPTTPAALISVVGNDVAGESLIAGCEARDVIWLFYRRACGVFKQRRALVSSATHSCTFSTLFGLCFFMGCTFSTLFGLNPSFLDVSARFVTASHNTARHQRTCL